MGQTLNRRPNTECSVCKAPIYRRLSVSLGPFYCSKKCYSTGEYRPCEFCKQEFYVPAYQDRDKKRQYCSVSCSNKGRRGINYGTGRPKTRNRVKDRIKILQDAFGFKTCMVKGCVYDRCFDIHRLVEGKHGGQYEIGNMFAICPNHHAEIHRNIVIVTKVNDFTLEVIDKP